MKYEVKFYYHTYGSVIVEADSEEDALFLADPSNINDAELLSNLQEDNDPDAELVDECVY